MGLTLVLVPHSHAVFVGPSSPHFFSNWYPDWYPRRTDQWKGPTSDDYVGKASYWSSVICSQSTLERNRRQQAALLLLLVLSERARHDHEHASLHAKGEATADAAVADPSRLPCIVPDPPARLSQRRRSLEGLRPGEVSHSESAAPIRSGSSSCR
jgi:hypothetical protein